MNCFGRPGFDPETYGFSAVDLKLIEIKPQKAGRAPLFPVAIIADDDNTLLALNGGRADTFGIRESR